MSTSEHEREPHFGPRPQTDWQAANSAEPDTERQPYGDDPTWEAYIAFLEGQDADDDDDFDDDDDDDDDGWEDEVEWNDEEDPGQAADEADMQRIADEWAAYDRDPPGS